MRSSRLHLNIIQAPRMFMKLLKIICISFLIFSPALVSFFILSEELLALNEPKALHNSVWKSKCELDISLLRTRVPINQKIKSFKEISDEVTEFSIKKSVTYDSSMCHSAQNVAIVVPYRDRENNLKQFLNHMHLFLIKQRISYEIFLIEPLKNLTFNRGLLMNIGFVEALKTKEDYWNCFVFHDVDLLPENEFNFYSCNLSYPKHMSSAVSSFNYKLPYEGIFGGVVALSRKKMERINGYSNLYFGWGGEDDDLRIRIAKKKLNMTRNRLDIGRYFMAYHATNLDSNKINIALLNSAFNRSDKDGLNTIEYKVIRTESNTLFTHILVSYDQEKFMKSIY